MIAKNQLLNKLNALDVEALFEVIKQLSSDTRKEADLIFNAALNILMGKTTEEQFIEKMELLDALI